MAQITQWKIKIDSVPSCLASKSAAPVSDISFIVWINGPFKPGPNPDFVITRGDSYSGDAGYYDGWEFSRPESIVLQNFKR